MRSRVMMFAALVACVWIALEAERATAQHRTGTFNRTPPGARQAEIHNPASPRFIDMQPNGMARRSDDHAHHHHPHVQQPVWKGNDCYPNHWGGNKWCGTPTPPCNFYPPYYSYWLPPAVLPAQSLYGPFAGGLFGGYSPAVVPSGYWGSDLVVDVSVANVGNNVGNVQMPPNNVQQGVPQGGADMMRRDRVDVARPVAPRTSFGSSNAERRAKARRFIGHGDNQFEQGEYHQAAQRYRLAIKAAPDLAEPHFRHAQALMAQGRYADAAAEFRLGGQLQPGWEKSNFRFEQVYGPEQAVRMQHLKELGAMAIEHDHEPDLMYLMGLSYYFGGQPGQSRPYFQRAAELDGSVAAHVAPFITEMDRQAAQALAAQDDGAGVEF